MKEEIGLLRAAASAGPAQFTAQLPARAQINCLSYAQ